MEERPLGPNEKNKRELYKWIAEGKSQRNVFFFFASVDGFFSSLVFFNFKQTKQKIWTKMEEEGEHKGYFSS